MQRSIPGRPRLVVTIALVILLATGSAMAQQFGRNQVRHRSFQFKVLRTEHFAIYYDSDATDAVRMAARMAERWHTRLTEVLAHDLQGEQPLILYASPGRFRQTNVVDAEIGEGVGGFAEFLRRRIVMPFVGDLGETDHVLGHEIVHAFQFDMIGTRWPLWFMEGMAEYLSLGTVDAQTAVWMRDAALSDRLPTIADLNDPRFFPYRYGQALFAYIGQRYGDRAIPAIMRRLGAPAPRGRSRRSPEPWGPCRNGPRSDPRHRTGPGRRSRDAQPGMAGVDPRDDAAAGRGARRTARRHTDRAEQQFGDERRARPQSRRIAGRVPHLEESPVHRPRGCRREHRPHPAHAAPHRRRPAPRRPAVHPLGGRMGPVRPARRHGRGTARPRGAGHRECRHRSTRA